MIRPQETLGSANANILCTVWHRKNCDFFFFFFFNCTCFAYLICGNALKGLWKFFWKHTMKVHGRSQTWLCLATFRHMWHSVPWIGIFHVTGLLCFQRLVLVVCVLCMALSHKDFEGNLWLHARFKALHSLLVQEWGFNSLISLPEECSSENNRKPLIKVTKPNEMGGINFLLCHLWFSINCSTHWSH